MKRIHVFLAILVTVGNLASPLTAMAAQQWGDNTGRTHVNNLNDNGGYWNTSVTVSGITGTGTPEADSGTGMLFAPKSAANDTTNGALYAFNANSWVKNATGQYQPQQAWEQPIYGVLNSSPITLNGNVYIAGSKELYGFTESTGIKVSTSSYATDNIYDSSSSNNFVKSHPLYDPNTNAIWVSSANGNLYAINPSTLAREGYVQLAGGTESSPSIVNDSGGNHYVAVGISNISGGSGDVEIFNDSPSSPTLAASYQDPNGASIVGAIINTGNGNIMWNDIEGNVYHANLVYNSLTYRLSITNVTEYQAPSGTFTNQEGAYVHGVYLLPDTSSSNIEYVNGNTMTGFEVHSATGAANSGTPEVAAQDAYILASDGSVTTIPVSSINTSTTSSSAVQNTISQISASGTSAANLASTNMFMLKDPFGSSVPTMAFVTNGGLNILQNMPYSSATLNVINSATGSAQTVTNGQTITVSANTVLSFNVIGNNLKAQDHYSLSSSSVPFTYNTTSSSFTAPNYGINVQDSANKITLTSPSYQSASVPSDQLALPGETPLQIQNGQGDLSVSVVSTTPASDTITLWPPVGPIGPPAPLNITIHWTAVPTVTLRANPSTTNVGGSSTLTVTTKNMPASDHVIVAQTDTAAKGTLGVLHNQTSTVVTLNGSTGSTMAVSQSKATYDYTAQIEDTSGNAVATSSPVSVAWSGAPLRLSLTPANQTVAYNGTGTLNVSATGLTSNEYITVTDTSGNDTMSQNGFATNQYSGANGQGSFSIPISGGGNTATMTDNYKASVVNASGMSPTATATATFDGAGAGITLTASNTSPIAGQPITLTATGNGVQPYASITIFEVSGGNPNFGSLSTSSITETTAQMQGTNQEVWNNNSWYHTSYAVRNYADSTARAPQTITYQATLTNPNTGQMASSSMVTVTWSQPKVTLTANPSVLPVNSAAQLTAIDGNIPANGVLYVHQASGTNVGASPATVTQSTATSINYYAATQTEGYVYRSADTLVQWVNQATVSLSPNPTSQVAGSTIALNVSANNLTSGDSYTLLLSAQDSNVALRNASTTFIARGASYSWSSSAVSAVALSNTPIRVTLTNSNGQQTAASTNVSWTAASTPPSSGNLPTVTLTPSPSSTTVGSSVNMDMSFGNLSPSLSYTVSLTDSGGGGASLSQTTTTFTPGGSTYGLTWTARSNNALTNEPFTATITASTGQTNSSQATVSWTSSGSSGGGSIGGGSGLTLSASTTTPSQNQTVTLTASGAGITPGDTISILQITPTTATNTFSTGGTLNGTYYQDSGTVNPYATNVYDSVNQAGFTAEYYAQAINSRTGQIEATSNNVVVTWGSAPNITMAISAMPSTLPVLQTAQLNVVVSGLVNQDYVYVFFSGAILDNGTALQPANPNDSPLNFSSQDLIGVQYPQAGVTDNLNFPISESGPGTYRYTVWLWNYHTQASEMYTLTGSDPVSIVFTPAQTQLTATTLHALVGQPVQLTATQPGGIMDTIHQNAEPISMYGYTNYIGSTNYNNEGLEIAETNNTVGNAALSGLGMNFRNGQSRMNFNVPPNPLPTLSNNSSASQSVYDQLITSSSPSTQTTVVSNTPGTVTFQAHYFTIASNYSYPGPNVSPYYGPVGIGQSVPGNLQLVEQAGATSTYSLPITITWSLPPVPTVTLTASSTNLYVNQATSLTATAANLTTGDIVTIVDRWSANTLSGSNTQSSSGTFSTNATSANAISDSYYATVINRSGQTVATSSAVIVTWHATPSPIVTLTASSTNPSAGQSVGLVAQITQNYANGDQILIVDQGNQGTLNGANSASGSSAITYSVNATRDTAGSDSYDAVVLNASGQVISSPSSTVTVNWGQSIRLSASPTSAYTGQAIALTASFAGNASGDAIEFLDGNGWSTLSNASRVVSSASLPVVGTGMVDAISQQAGSDSFTASIVNASGQVLVSSSPVTVTWMQASTITLKANQSLVAVGTSATLTTSGANYPANYIVKIIDLTSAQTFQGNNQVSGFSDPFSATVVSGTAQSVLYQAQVIDENGNVAATSNTVQITWQHSFLTNGQIFGLKHDPGYPGSSGVPVNMWLSPAMNDQTTVYASSDYYLPWFEQHGWDGQENDQHESLAKAMGSGVDYQPDLNRGPQASQATGTFTSLDGKQHDLYGYGQSGKNPWGTLPWAWVRPEGQFGFLFTWEGSVTNEPVGGSVTWTMTNPDGASRTWSAPFQIITSGLATPMPLDGWMPNPSPIEQLRSKLAVIDRGSLVVHGSAATERIMGQTSVPNYVFQGGGSTSNGNNIELAAWSLASNATTVKASSAQISVEIQLQLQNGRVITFMQPDMVSLFNLPSPDIIEVGSDTFTQRAQKELQNNSGVVGMFPNTMKGIGSSNPTTGGTLITTQGATVLSGS